MYVLPTKMDQLGLEESSEVKSSFRRPKYTRIKVELLIGHLDILHVSGFPTESVGIPSLCSNINGQVHTSTYTEL